MQINSSIRIKSVKQDSRGFIPRTLENYILDYSKILDKIKYDVVKYPTDQENTTMPIDTKCGEIL